MNKMISLAHSYLRETALLLTLILLVLVFNIPTLKFNLIYNEQAPLYLANQHVNSLLDLIKIYLHPQLLYEHGILFFRPSGHFLMYQLFAPILGWHNIKGFLVVSLIFLALSGYMMIKIYHLLFPQFKVGGYIAFSIYLMHPALIISRMMIEHFDFAHIFFCLLSLYFFIIFCQQNKLSTTVIKEIKLTHFRPLILSLIFYAVAVTFKEVALFLAAVLISYLLITLYHKQRYAKFFSAIIHCREINRLLLLLVMTSLLLTAYISMAWEPLMTLQNEISFTAAAHTLVRYFEYFTGLWRQTHYVNLVDYWLADGIIFPGIIRITLYCFCILLLISTLIVYTKKSVAYFKKSLTFLYLALLIFLIVPVIYSVRVNAGHPWHLNLSLVFFCLLLGFSFELMSQFFCKKYSTLIGLMVAIMIGAGNIVVTNTHIYEKHDKTSFILELNRNAVLNPPDIKSKLTPDSVIIIEDKQPLGYYLLGDSFIYANYPAFAHHHLPFLKPSPVYNSLLFRWAYLLPGLKEQVYPFQVNKMIYVPDAVIYSWLRHYNNIYCLGYDDQARWHDNTTHFKNNLLLEQGTRRVKVNAYHTLAITMVKGGVLYSKKLPVPSSFICQYECDQNTLCRGFVYLAPMKDHHTGGTCVFLSALYKNTEKFCAPCTTFIKLNPFKNNEQG